MNVKLVAQTLSESVSTALTFASQCYPLQFNLPEETALFCSTFNNAFDLLNVRSKFCKQTEYKIALTSETFDNLKINADNIIKYIKQLRDSTNRPILQIMRKTGFLGFIICLTNMFDLFNVLENKGLTYLLTYKLNQDHLKTFLVRYVTEEDLTTIPIPQTIFYSQN